VEALPLDVVNSNTDEIEVSTELSEFCNQVTKTAQPPWCAVPLGYCKAA
jgi:hypothetical protein